MVGQKHLSKLADIPLAKPGYDTLNMAAPFIVQMNADGKWESSKPPNLDEEKLKNIISTIVNSKTAIAAQDYCTQCAAEQKMAGGSSPSNYVPVIVMPILPSDQCPFDLECEIQKLHDEKKKNKKQVSKKAKDDEEDDEEEQKAKHPKKRGFVLQRLTDFDLLSQW